MLHHRDAEQLRQSRAWCYLNRNSQQAAIQLHVDRVLQHRYSFVLVSLLLNCTPTLCTHTRTGRQKLAACPKSPAQDHQG